MADEEQWYTVTWSAQVKAATPMAAMTGVQGVTQIAARVGPEARPAAHCASCDGHACPGVG